jgi:hypothetical protein
MMVVCKDRIDRIKISERMGVEAAVAVEPEITALLSGKSYDHLVTLQKQVQAKLVSKRLHDTNYTYKTRAVVRMYGKICRIVHMDRYIIV